MGSKKKKTPSKKTRSTKKFKKTTKRVKEKTISSMAGKKSISKGSKAETPSNISRKDAIKLIKSQLLNQKKILLGEAGATLNNMPAAILYPDLGDQAGMEIERNFLLRLRGREQKLLKKIDEALERIDNGTFGLCEICGREIDLKRLMARPVTTMCIECKTEQEEEERLREM
ncbi:MAG: TraR/DksA C4-type zinc finger protein [Thermodesulfovibrionales bacterium]